MISLNNSLAPLKGRDKKLIEDSFEELQANINLNLDLSELKCDKWLPEDRIKACLYHIILGSSIKASKYCGIPAVTIRYWTRQQWWQEASRQIRKTQNELLDIKLTTIINKTSDQLLDRIENGEYKLAPNGEIIKIPMHSRDLAVAGMAVPFDKRALIRGDPTSRIERTGVDETLKKLKDHFEQLVKPQGNSRNPCLIENGDIVENG